MNHVPQPIVHQIADFLDVKSLLNLSRVHQQLHRYLSNSYLEKRITRDYCDEFPVAAPPMSQLIYSDKQYTKVCKTKEMRNRQHQRPHRLLSNVLSFELLIACLFGVLLFSSLLVSQ